MSTVPEPLLRYGEPMSPAAAVRSDAARNRVRLLDAASALVATHGGDVDVREIARHAGVGMGTLYRHFPTKQVLLDAAVAHAVDEWAAAARAAMTGDAWPDLCGFLADALARQAGHRGLMESYGRGPAAGVDRCRHSVGPLIAELVGAARAAGALRADVTVEDVSLLLIALGRVAVLAPGAWQRPLQVALDGLRAGPATTELSLPPLSPEALDRALGGS